MVFVFNKENFLHLIKFGESFSLGSLLNQSQTYQGNPCGVYPDLSSFTGSGVIQNLRSLYQTICPVRFTSSGIRASALDTGSILSYYFLCNLPRFVFCPCSVICILVCILFCFCFVLVCILLHSGFSSCSVICFLVCVFVSFLFVSLFRSCSCSCHVLVFVLVSCLDRKSVV